MPVEQEEARTGWRWLRSSANRSLVSPYDRKREVSPEEASPDDDQRWTRARPLAYVHLGRYSGDSRYGGDNRVRGSPSRQRAGPGKPYTAPKAPRAQLCSGTMDPCPLPHALAVNVWPVARRSRLFRFPERSPTGVISRRVRRPYKYYTKRVNSL
jgi:hypothetical protein